MSYLIELQKIKQLHDSPNRHYHNSNHIDYCESKLMEYTNFLESSDRYTEDTAPRLDSIISAAYHAIQFHDVVYSIWANPGQNEERSAEVFLSFHKRHNMEELVDANEVYDAILATGRHTSQQTGLSLASKLMLDVDLASFGERYELVRYNTENVLREYLPMCLPKIELLRNRVQFLYSLLSRPTLFYTDFFLTRYEKAARHNIGQLISETKLEIRQMECFGG